MDQWSLPSMLIAEFSNCVKSNFDLCTTQKIGKVADPFQELLEVLSFEVLHFFMHGDMFSV